MTREEAIKELEYLSSCSYVDRFEPTEKEALRIAINALKEKTYIIQLSARGAGKTYFEERMKKLNEGN